MELRRFKDFYDIMLEFGFKVNNHNQFMYNGTFFGKIEPHILCETRPFLYYNFYFMTPSVVWHENWEVTNRANKEYWFADKNLTEKEIRKMTINKNYVSTVEELRIIVSNLLNDYKKALIQAEKENIHCEKCSVDDKELDEFAKSINSNYLGDM